MGGIITGITRSVKPKKLVKLYYAFFIRSDFQRIRES